MIGFISNQTLDNVIASDPAIVSLLPNFDAETVPAKKDFFFKMVARKISIVEPIRNQVRCYLGWPDVETKSSPIFPKSTKGIFTFRFTLK